MSSVSRLALATAALVVLPATAASAHPAFNPNQIPSGEPVEATLVVPHGCAPGGGMPGDGESLPTVELAIQTHEGVTIEPGEIDGWDTTVDDEAVTWTDAGGATTDVIELPATVMVDGGAAGDELYLSAFQGCEGGESFRWVALPDEEGFPAVKLTVTEGGVGTEETAGADHADMDMSEGEHETEAMSDGEHEMEMEAPAESGAQALAGQPADGGIGIGVLVALIVVGLLLFGGLVAVARGRQAT